MSSFSYGDTPVAGSPEQVNEFHKNDDADRSWDAHHHTLGFRPTQAAPGDKLKEALDRIQALEDFLGI